MSSAKVVRPGLWTSLQNGGRANHGEYGVPVGGAMDQSSYLLGNHLLNNRLGMASLECTLYGPKLEFQGEAQFVLTGGDGQFELNSKKIVLYKVYRVTNGSILDMKAITKGCRTYISVAGGWASPLYLNCSSWYVPITPKNRVITNEILPVNQPKETKRNQYARVKIYSQIASEEEVCEIAAYKGPEYRMLSMQAIECLHSTLYTVSNNADRMAIRLVETLPNQLPSIRTGPVLPGTVQLTPDGTLIVLMRDCQTTGGYPRILQLSENAIDSLAQLRANASVQFLIK